MSLKDIYVQLFILVVIFHKYWYKKRAERRACLFFASGLLCDLPTWHNCSGPWHSLRIGQAKLSKLSSRMIFRSKMKELLSELSLDR